ncbi:MAG: META domain-containing protein [Allosphingosinicella sp.]|uniref:META domain-containing protein n=1 Tax=Allosphingosinicella sp. TaxID=2823234 RepID=UPI0039362F0B
MRSLVPALSAVLLLSACAGWGGGTAGQADARGIEWIATDIAGRAPVGDRPITLRLQRGRDLAGGEAGCNVWHAGYRVGRGTLSFSEIGSTRRFCPEPLLGQENAFLGLLAEVDRYTVWADGTLTLATPTGRTVSFRRAAAP